VRDISDYLQAVGDMVLDLLDHHISLCVYGAQYQPSCTLSMLDIAAAKSSKAKIPPMISNTIID